MVKDAALTILVNSVRVAHEQHPLSILDQFPQEVKEKEQLANAMSIHDDCLVNGLFSQCHDDECNVSVTVAHEETTQVARGNLVCK